MNTNLPIGANITIEAGAKFNILTDNGINGIGDINNFGTLEKTNGSPGGKSAISVIGFNNNPGGKVIVSKGKLWLDPSAGTSGGGSKFAAFLAEPAGTLLFAGSAWTINSATTMTGQGQMIILGPSNWTLNADLVTRSHVLRMDRVVIGGAGNLTIGDARTSCFGAVVQVISPGTVDIKSDFSIGSSGCTFGGSTINVEGKLDVSGPLSLGVTNFNTLPGSVVVAGDGSVFNSSGGGPTLWTQQGTFNFNTAGNVVIDYNGSMVSEGNMEVIKGLLNIGGTFSVPITQTGGTISVSNGGEIQDSAPIQEQGGSIFGDGKVFVPINDTGGNIQGGTDAIPGILNIDQPLAQAAGSTMTANFDGTVAAGAPGKFSQINNSSSVALGGTLNLKFLNGFSPAPGHKFNILNFASSSGAFSSVVTSGKTCKAHLTTTSTSLSVSFTSKNVSVTISPKTATVKVNQQQQFTDTVTNGCGNGVKWSVKESGGGTVTQQGLYTAPGNPGTYHVVVTSVADPTKSDTATVTVTTAAAKAIAVIPHAAVVHPGGRVHLQANAAVTWSVAEGISGGSISSTGTYTAAAKPGLYHVLATSVADSAQHAIVNIAVVNGKLKSAYVADLDQNAVSVLSGSLKGLSAGQLSEMQSVSAGHAPVALALSPNGKSLLSANRNSNSVSLFAVSPADGRLHIVPGPAMDTGTHPSAIAFDSRGRMAFVANRDSDDISVFSLNRGSDPMVLLGKQALAAGDQPSGVAVHPSASLVFVTSSGSNSVRGFGYAKEGMLKPLNGSPLATGKNPSAAVIDTAGKFLFVANRGSSDVSVFAIDAKHETLQEVSGSPFAAGKGAAALALDITGSYLFVANHGSNDVTAFQVDGETGALTLLGHTPLPAGASGLAVDPSGQYLYVTSDRTNVLVTLRLNVATGQLTGSSKTAIKGKASSIVVAGSAATSSKIP